jgi:hypothetical protein
MSENPTPNSVQYHQCSTLVAKVMIADDHVFSASEIALARELQAYEWNAKVTDFLSVIAGIAHAGLEVEEAYWALIYEGKS